MPEYLREERTRIWPVAAAVLIGVGLALAGLFTFGPKELRLISLGSGAAESGEDQPAAQPLVDPTAAQAGAVPEAAATETQPSDQPPANNTAAGDASTPAAATDATAPVATPAGDEPPVAEQPAAPGEAMPDESSETTRRRHPG